MKIPSLQTFILQEDLNHTLLNDIYVMASAPNTTEEYGQRLQKITADDILRRFQTEAWPEILDILTREFMHIVETDEFQLMDAAGDEYGGMDSDAADVERLESVLGIGGVEQLRSFRSQMDDLVGDAFDEDVPVGFVDVQEIFKRLKSSFTLHTMINAFEHLSWEPVYGGEAWADIAKAVLKIGETMNQKNFGYFYKALDHFVDLAHNTNSVLDKFKGYNERWLFYWVDLKRYSKSVYDLNPISKSVKEYLKVSRQDIPQQLRQRTPAKQNLYEVLLRGKQFTQTLTDGDHNLTLNHLANVVSNDIEVLQVLKRNGITVPVFLHTVKQILDNIKSGQERLIEPQEKQNANMLSAFFADWNGIFARLLHIAPDKTYLVLKKLGLPSKDPNTQEGAAANKQIAQQYADLTQIQRRRFN